MNHFLFLSFLFAPAWASTPVITAVTPAELTTAGGPIVIHGSGFLADATVKVANYPCTDVKVVSDAEIHCTAAVNIARRADVAVLNGDGALTTAPSAIEYKGIPSFALLQQRVFVRFGVNSQGVTLVLKCTGCHGGAKPDGNLDMKDHAQVFRRVTANAPESSLLYTEVRDGKMPPKERQPELKPEEKRAIFDWIAAGAPNN